MKAGWTQNEKLNYEGVTTDAPAPLEPGLYRARVIEAKPQPTKAGDPMLKLTIEVFENDKGEKLPLKRKLTDNMVLSQAAAFRILIISKALDIEPLSETNTGAATEFCKEIVKASKNGCWVRVKQEEYTGNDGQTRVTGRVDRYLSDKDVADEAAKAKEATAGSNGATARRPRGGKAEEPATTAAGGTA